MDEKLVQRGYRLTSEQVKRLTLLAAATRVPISEYIRQGVELALAKHEAEVLMGVEPQWVDIK